MPEHDEHVRAWEQHQLFVDHWIWDAARDRANPALLPSKEIEDMYRDKESSQERARHWEA